METSVVTMKGQVVIPARIRQHLGIRQGTKVCFIEREGEISIRPLTKDYFESMAGHLKTKGSLARQLLAERKKERKREGSR